MFLSKDPVLRVLGEQSIYWNSYAYVHNNPVNLTDPSGEFIPLLILGGAAIGAFVTTVLEFNRQGFEIGKDSLADVNWRCVLNEALKGALVGAAIASLLINPSAAIFGGITNVVGSVISDYLSRVLAGENPSLLRQYFSNPDRVLLDFVIGAAFGGAFAVRFASTVGKVGQRAVGFGAINVLQGVTTRTAYNTFQGTDYQVFNPISIAFDFALASGTSALVDNVTNSLSALFNPRRYVSTHRAARPGQKLSMPTNMLQKERTLTTQAMEGTNLYLFLTTLLGTNITGPTIYTPLDAVIQIRKS